MSKFFESIVDYNLYKQWVRTLDWLFDDNKFSCSLGWTPNNIGRLTKKIKKLSNFSKDKNYIYASQKNLKFPVNNENGIYAIFSKGNSECRDFIRHIRNGIAHGNTRCFKTKNGLFIEIIDYKGDEKKIQTAYMCFPICYITETHKLYCEVKKSFENNKKRN